MCAQVRRFQLTEFLGRCGNERRCADAKRPITRIIISLWNFQEFPLSIRSSLSSYFFLISSHGCWLFIDIYVGWSFRQWPQFNSIWQDWGKKQQQKNTNEYLELWSRRTCSCRRLQRQQTNYSMKPSLLFQLFRPLFYRVTRLSSRKHPTLFIVRLMCISGGIISGT